jgi:LytS/YehU family sensor histidine kinase
MLRHILYDYQQTTVPLKDEVTFLENYVNLMRIRLPDAVDIKFNTMINVPDSVQIAPMLFISLIENAFKHGISPTKPSFIHIEITAQGHTLVCDIRNSNYPKTAQDRSGHGIGLQQVQRRLELAYHNHYTWEKGVSDNQKVYQSTITIIL